MAAIATGKFIGRASIAIAKFVKKAVIATAKFIKIITIATGKFIGRASVAIARAVKKITIAVAKGIAIACVATAKLAKKAVISTAKILKTIFLSIGKGAWFAAVSFGKFIKRAWLGIINLLGSTFTSVKNSADKRKENAQKRAEQRKEKAHEAKAKADLRAAVAVTTGQGATYKGPNVVLELFSHIKEKTVDFFTLRKYKKSRTIAGFVALSIVFINLGILLATQFFTADAQPTTSPVEVQKLSATAKPEQTVQLRVGTADPDLWSLLYVSELVPLPREYSDSVTYVVGPTSEQQCDARILEALETMFNDAEAAGLPLYFRSGYRSYDTQEILFETMYQDYLASGMTEDEAFAATKALRNEAGTSEHETGLAVDIVPARTPSASLVAELENEPEIQWLHENCTKYGFILRYPKDKTDITGISYEPWHFRYVGVEDAVKMTENNLTMEEYLGMV